MPPMPPAAELDALRAEALAAARRYAERPSSGAPFVPGETHRPGGRPGDRRARARGARRRLARRLAHRGPLRATSSARASRRWPAARRSLLVGSGSQANLLAVAAACSHLHERPLQPGDEVITPALGFPTTVSPLYQYGLCRSTWTSSSTRSTRRSRRSRPRSATRTRAIVIAHCLGNPFDARRRGRALPRARPRADRGLLRRARLHPRRPPVGRFGAGRDLLVLPRPPHDHGRGRRGGGGRPHLAARRSARCASGAATAGARRA